MAMSLAQEQIWLRSLRAAEGQAFYNENITIHGNGPLDLTVLERAFTEIVRRHEVWRTSIEDGTAVQVVHPAPDKIDIPVLDLRAVRRTATVAQLAKAFAAGDGQAPLAAEKRASLLLQRRVVDVLARQSWIPRGRNDARSGNEATKRVSRPVVGPLLSSLALVLGLVVWSHYARPRLSGPCVLQITVSWCP